MYTPKNYLVDKLPLNCYFVNLFIKLFIQVHSFCITSRNLSIFDCSNLSSCKDHLPVFTLIPKLKNDNTYRLHAYYTNKKN